MKTMKTMKTMKDATLYAAYLYKLGDDGSNPDKREIKLFSTEKDAVEYVNSLSLEIGYQPLVELITVDGDDYESYQDGDIDDYNLYLRLVDFEDVYEGDVYEGDSIGGAVILEWSWEKFIGYARNFHGLRWGNINETEVDLADETERPWGHTETVLLTKEEILGLSEDAVVKKVEGELKGPSWKWNYRSAPPREIIIK